MSYLNGLPINNQSLNGIISITDGSDLLIENGQITGCSKLQVDNLEVGNLIVDVETQLNDVNIISANVSILNSTTGIFSNISSDKAIFNNLTLSNIYVNNANVSGNIYTNNIKSLNGICNIGKVGEQLNLYGNILMFGNVEYIGSNTVQYVDNNLQLNIGGGNTTAQGGGLNIMGGNGNVVVAGLTLDSNLNWNLTSNNNRLIVSSANITNANITTLIGNVISTGNLIANNGNVLNMASNVLTSGNINVNNGNIVNLQSNISAIGNLQANNGNISYLTSNTVVFGNINANNANIYSIVSNVITSGNINVNNGNILYVTSNVITSGNCLINNANIINVTATNGNINTISSNTINSSKLLNDYVFSNKIVNYSSAFNHLNVSSGRINNATLNRAKVLGNLTVNQSVNVNQTVSLNGISFSNSQLPFKIYYGSSTTVGGNITVSVSNMFTALPVITVSVVFNNSNMRPCWITTSTFNTSTNTVTFSARSVDTSNTVVPDGTPINYILVGI